MEINQAPPLNAMRVFVAIARELSVTRAADSVGITQSAASRHLAVLEKYLGARLVSRRGRIIELTEFGRQYFNATADALDGILFTNRHMRQQRNEIGQRLVVRSSLPTFTQSIMIPRLPQFLDVHKGTSIDIVTSQGTPSSRDLFDVFITSDIQLREAADEWNLLEEHLVCVCAPTIASSESIEELVARIPFITVTARPDILPRWSKAMSIPLSSIIQGPRFEHLLFAIPAAASGQGILVTPDIIVLDAVQSGALATLPKTRVKSGINYRAYSVDRTERALSAHAFCRWLARSCREQTAKCEQ
jgi:LysR family glycine cleavage system transcriptional activator